MGAMPLTGEHETSNHPDWAQDQIDTILRTGTTDGLGIQGMEIVLITYRGRKTGKLRRLPLMRVEHDGVYAAVASKGGAPEHPGWYTSIRDEPHVELQDGTVTKDYIARELSGEEREVWWKRSVAAYPPYAEYQEKTDRLIPVFVLEPTD
jgi:deazaflavin-dependent oxidoreductase (nitroreductase family)